MSCAATPNRFIVGPSLAVMVCKGHGVSFGVTVDAEDVSRIREFGKWYIDSMSGILYCCSHAGRRKTYLHRFVMGADQGSIVDHRHHRTLDNRKSELHVTTQALNVLNSKRRINKHGFRGVYSAGSNFIARIKVSGKMHNLGTYKTPQEAGAAVKQFLSSIGMEWAANKC